MIDKLNLLCRMNRLCELPRGFGGFSSLEILDLTYNNLHDGCFPGNWKFLGESLRGLYMGDNDLTKFPPDIMDFKKLTVVSGFLLSLLP